MSLVYKELNIGNPGSTVKFGGNDLDIISKLLNGVTSGIPAVVIKSTNDFGFADGILWIYNQAANRKITLRGPTNTPATDVDLGLPPITGNDMLAAIGLSNVFSVKQQFNAGILNQEMIEPASPSATQHMLYIDSTSKHLIRKNSAGQKVDYDIPVGAGAPNTATYVTMTTDAALTQERTLAVGDGLSLTDGGAGNPVTIAQNTIDMARKRVQFIEDAIGPNVTSGNFKPVVSGTGAAVNDLTVGGLQEFGVWELNTGTTATGKSAIQAGNLSSFSLGQGLATLESCIKVPALSTVGEEFILRTGFLDSVTGAAIDGVHFIYDRLSSVNWRIECKSNNVATTTSTTTPVANTPYIRLKIVVNAAGTSASFFVNGTEVSGSPITTNIPVGAGRETSIVSSLIKSAGTTARTANIDYVAFEYDLTTPR